MERDCVVCASAQTTSTLITCPSNALGPSVLACIATCRTANVIPIRDFPWAAGTTVGFHRDRTLFFKTFPLTSSVARTVALSVDSSHNSRAFFFPVTSMGRARSRRYDVGWRWKYQKKKRGDDEDADQRRVTSPRLKEPDQQFLDVRMTGQLRPASHSYCTRDRLPDPEATCCCGSGSTEFDAELTPSR